MAFATDVSVEAPFEDAFTRNVRAVRRRLVAGALVVVLLITALGLVWRQYENAKDEAVNELEARAVLAATVFEIYFTGQLAALSAIAASPPVVAGDTDAMSEYFARFRPGSDSPFTAGVGWIDLDGRQRATSDPRGPIDINLGDRSYFERAIATRKPFVAEAIVAATTQRRLVVMSVPTRDRRGRITGVLAGGLVLPQSTNDARASDLGFAGLQVIDRRGQLVTRRDLARPRNSALVTQLRKAKEGALVDARGLDGSDGRVLAYASSPVASWTTVLDQPASTVFAEARRSLILEALLVAAGTAVALALIAWSIRGNRRSARANRSRIRRWAGFTRSLNEAVDGDEIRDILAGALAAEFPKAAVIASLDPREADDPPSATIVRGGRSSVAELGESAALSIAGRVARADAPVALDDRAQLERLSTPPEVVARARSLYGVSLADEDRLAVGSAALLFAGEQGLEQHELSVVQAHTEQAAQALARVRRHEHEHDAAVLLQQSLLPETLPEIDGVGVGAYYRAGQLHTTAGGDWYDVVRRPDGIVHLTVGDVAGRGIDAAVRMGHLRSAFRAYALDHVSPAAIVERLARHVEDEGMATTVCVSYDPYTRELSYASAGHLPALLLHPNESTVTRLEETGRAPLGWLTTERLADQQYVAPADSVLALYTDGLVERRGQSLDDEIERLGAAIQAAVPAEPGTAVRHVVEQMGDEHVGDDVALLLVGLGEPAALELELPAEAERLRELRRRVRSWLSRRGLDRSAREDAVLALSEACNNAIEHGYRNTPGTIRVSMDHGGETLTIRVEDDGQWRQPVEDSDRGRGIIIMRALMESANIVQKSHGTEVVLHQRL